MTEAIRILFHAPTAASLQRARRSAVNITEAHPAAEILIVVNAEGAETALVRHDEATDPLIVICEATLRRNGLKAPPGRRTTPLSTLFMAERQAEGWTYIRA
jgi:intracellular sulfur oxidation DsrE/DsrF family protein